MGVCVMLGAIHDPFSKSINSLRVAKWVSSLINSEI